MNLEQRIGIGKNLEKRMKDKDIVHYIYKKVKNKTCWSEVDVYECFDREFINNLKNQLSISKLDNLFFAVVLSVDDYYSSQILSKENRPNYQDLKKYKKSKQIYMNHINKKRQQFNFWKPLKLKTYE